MFEQFLGKLRKYEIRMRKAVTSERHGNFHSVFKGSGLEFDDLRLYQYGDDVRAIDWNTSAKGHGTFVKIFKEDKEQTAFFMLDVSASQQVGEVNKLKIDIAKEICGVLTLSAIQEATRVGLLCFSDRNERYIRPSDGMGVYRKHSAGLSNVHSQTNQNFLLNRKEMFENVDQWLGYRYHATIEKTLIKYERQLSDLEKIGSSN